MHQHLPVVCLLDEVIQHLFCDFEICDYSIFHRLDRDDVPRRSSQHLFGFFAHGLNFVGVLVEGHNRGLIHDDPLASRVNQCVGSSQVDRKIAGKNAEQ